MKQYTFTESQQDLLSHISQYTAAIVDMAHMDDVPAGEAVKDKLKILDAVVQAANTLADDYHDTEAGDVWQSIADQWWVAWKRERDMQKERAERKAYYGF